MKTENYQFPIKETVIPQVRTITRYGTGSVILFNYAERNSLVKQSEQSPTEPILEGDWLRRAKGAVQTGSQGSFLRLFALSYGMTAWGVTKM